LRAGKGDIKLEGKSAVDEIIVCLLGGGGRRERHD
jgi:hypothetical protein